MDKIRVVMLADSLRLDGISAVIMNYCTHIDLNKFDITIMAGVPVLKIHETKCKELGIKIEILPSRKKSSMAFYCELNKKLKSEQFDICHVHGNSATSVVELAIARLNHIRIRIMHCHNSRCQHEKVNNLLRPIFKRMYTKAFACSTLAGNWIFGEGKFSVIPNGFVTDHYKFDIEKREQYRKILKLEGAFVIGHVGHTDYQKNPWFVIKTFEKYVQREPEAKLLMIGNGSERKNIEEYVSKSKYKDRIIIYGESSDVAGLLSAMDLFLFPSRYEGLGISVVEAQISGLPCIVSDVIPQEVKVGDKICFLPIDETGNSIWEEAIMEFHHMKYDRLKYCDDNKACIEKYNIQSCVKQLENIYISLCNAKS